MIFVAAIDVFFIIALLVALAITFFQLGRGFEIGKQKAIEAARNEDLVRRFG
jgi:hypothetical protein